MRLTAQQIIDRCRRLLDDEVTTYLWPDAELVDYLNEAIYEVAERSQMLRDSETSSIVEIALVEDTSDYAISNKIISIERAKIEDQSTPLSKKDLEYLDTFIVNWEAAESGVPLYYIPDYQQSKIKLYPIPNADMDTLILSFTVIRYPATDITTGDLAVYPEITQYHEDLVYGILRRCFLKDDEDTQNLQKAQLYETKFEQSVRKIVDRVRKTNKPRQMRAVPHPGLL